MIIIDAKDSLLGRIGTFVAKKAMMGEDVIIVNCNDIYVSGKKSQVFAHYRRFRDMGVHTKGPFYSRRVDFFVKRAFRGMIPYKTSRGREALSRVKCYVSVPKLAEGKEMITLKDSHISKLPNMKYVSVKEICKHLGGKE
jgi:large subunit ribosomal protein L13